MTTDNAIIRRDVSIGKVQESAATIDDSGTVNIPTGQTYNINGSPHTHLTSSVYDSDVIFSDTTAGNADSDAHGFLPKLSGSNSVWLDGTGAWTVPSGSGLTNSNISPTTSNVAAAVNYRYFADVSGLTNHRNFVVPAGAVGDIIELNIKTGDDTYALVIIGDTGVSINGGSTATEWSRLFITGEFIRLVADTTSNWQVVDDKRIPCMGLLELSGADTTNTANTATTPTWDTKVIDRGEMGDTTNYRFNVRRAGYYSASGSYVSNTTISATKSIILQILKGATAFNERYEVIAATNYTVQKLPPKNILCAVGDTLTFKYQPEEANRGIGADDRSYFQVEEVL